MKPILLLVIAGLGLSLTASAQNRKPTVLLGPADWRFESMPVPPPFAPDVKVKGFEEARFSPGMFDTGAGTYFTYTFILSLEGTDAMGTDELKDFLERYFRGLSRGVGRRKGFTPDFKQIVAEVTKAAGGTGNKFEAKVPYFDTFNDGRKIQLNLEITVTPSPALKRTFIVLLISPQPHDGENWKKLHEVGETTAASIAKITADGGGK